MTRSMLRFLLSLAPASFRERHGAELVEVHVRRRDGRARRSPLRGLRAAAAAVAFATLELHGVLRLVIRLRLGRHVEFERLRATRERGTMIDGTVQDIRFALRTLGRSPAFTASAVVVLALGIGASIAIFSAANAFFFQPLPFAQPDRLVRIFETNPEFGWTDADAAPANVLDWREQVAAFDDVAMYSGFRSEVTYLRDGEPELLTFSAVSGNFFDVLGVRPAVGRGFRFEETWSANDLVAVLSHGLWISHFGGDPGVIGRTMEFPSVSVEIVGVMPEGFRFPHDDTHLWTPYGWATEAAEAVWFRRAHFVRPVARLASGVTHAQAAAQLETVVARLQAEYPETNSVMGAGIMPLRDFLVRDARATVLVLSGAVALLLLIACTNVANLLLVRATDRTREMALRFALGAGRARLGLQLITESLVLATLGGLAGLGLGWVGVRAIAARTDVGIEGATGLALDVRVVLFAIAVSLAAGALFGVLPALKVAREDIQTSLRGGGRSASAGRRSLRTANLLVAAEVALALLLVVGSGLMIRSALALRAVDPGFRTDGVLAFQLTVPSGRYAERDDVLAFWDDLARRLEARPGIERVGMVGHLPLSGTGWSSQFQAEGWPEDRVGLEIVHRRADSGYFEALDIPLARGRLFEATDEADAPLVVVINETFARTHFPGEDPIGQRIAYDRAATADSTWYEIVGIVGDQLQVDPGTPARAEAFENRGQDWSRTQWVVVRAPQEAASVYAVAEAVLDELDPLLPIAQARTLRDVWRTSMAREEAMLALLTAFGAVALILSAVGIYGVTAQAARKRTQEIGIRMALGATAPDVVRMMLRLGLTAVAYGLLVGTLAALAATRALDAFLFGIQPADLTTFVLVVALLGGVAALASWLPARRATTIDPVESLRVE